MLYFIAGRKNSGKTTAAHSVLRDCVMQKKSTMLIVPKQFTFESDKGILHALGPRLACEVEVLSFSRLADTVLKSYGGITKPVAKQGARAVFMAVALEGLQDKLKVFAKHKNEIALVNKMLDAVDDFKVKGITADALEKTADTVTDSTIKEKLLETALIYRTYEAVVAQGHFDDADLLDKIYDILLPTDFFNEKTIVIDGFREFTYPERRLISLMMGKAENVYITLCTRDPAEISDLSAFAVVNSTYRKLKSAADKIGVDCKTIITDSRSENVASQELLFLEENLYSPVFTPYRDETKDIEIISAPVLAQECDAVARRIKELLRDDFCRARDIAVVYRSDLKYEKAIKQALKKYGVSVFEDKRQPVNNQPLISFMRNLLLICSDGFDSDYIFRYLKTGLCSLNEDEISEIENYVFIWNINKKQWLEEWTANPVGYGVELDEKRLRQLKKINALREKIIAPLIKIKDQLENADAKQAITYLYRFLRDNGIDENLKKYALELESRQLIELALEQEQVWDILMEVFDEIALTLQENKVSISRLCEIFNLTVSFKSLGKLPDGYDEVFISSADRMLTKNAKAVFVVGMNSGVFPLTGDGTVFFSAREIKKLQSAGFSLFDDVKQFAFGERFFVYSALSAATEKLFLSYSTATATGEKLTRSEIVDRLEKLFPNIRQVCSKDDDIMLYIQGDESAFEYMAKNWHEDTAALAALKSYFSSHDGYSSRLQAIKRATDKSDYSFKDSSKAVKLFGKDMRFSATRLETYSKCPFMYFCKYGIYAKPRVAARLDPALGGTIVHYVLEKILADNKGEALVSMKKEEMSKQVEFYLNAYMQKYMGGGDGMSERLSYLYSRMKKVLIHLLERLCEEFSQSDFEPCDFELDIGNDERVKPFSVELEQGRVELIGMIDRVDKMDLDGKRYIRIVDYKTGGKDFNLGDVFSGLNMQMLLYLMSIWRTGTGFYENITPSGVLYFPAKITPFKANRGAQGENRQADILSQGKMSGMLVDDGDVILHMDKNRKGIFLPVKYDKKTGEVKGNFISLKQLERLGEIIDETIKNMGDSLHSGFVPASPIFSSGHTDTCLYCDYSSVCLKDAPNYRYMKKLSHSDCLIMLSGGEDNGEKLD